MILPCGQWPGIFIATDSINDVFFTHDGGLYPTGWDINDIRFAYDMVSDTGYFGTCLLIDFRGGHPQVDVLST